MTDEDIRRLQETLGITLPASYRTRMAAFPVPAAAGNTDLGVWDSADRLLQCRARRGAPGGVKPWPARFFAIGHAGDGCPHALDLEAGDAVWWIDHCHLDNPGSHKETDSFSARADDYFAMLREEMTGEGVDPNGTPAERAAKEAKGARESAAGCVLAAVVVAAIVFGILWFLRR